MATHGPITIPSAVTKTLICVDLVENGEFSGRLINPFMPEILPFQNSMHFIALMESFFDLMDFPQANYTSRAFRPSAAGPSASRKSAEIVRYRSDKFYDEERGEIATFILTIQFRQNVSWQGVLGWIEGKRTQNIRSALELLRLIDDALVRQLRDTDFLASW